jgi:hypothetical protein
MNFRTAGMTTEPAFDAALGLAGNPYDALVTLQMLGDDQLRAVIEDLSFVTVRSWPPCTVGGISRTV